MLTYITEVKNGEPDILEGCSKATLVIRSLEGQELHREKAPVSGWKHALLTGVQPEGVVYGADAYLGDMWIGSTEV